jgi:hypothetical protein
LSNTGERYQGPVSAWRRPRPWKDAVRTWFGAFYAALFDRTLERKPGAVVTEYACPALTCEPCPGPVLNANDFMTLGADVLERGQEIAAPALPP